MINFAVIGSNWITEKFIHAAHQSGLMRLAAVYSRKMETARPFAAMFDVTTCYDDLEQLASAAEIAAVYIASPNSLHCEQAIVMMQRGKHVICEKPLGSNLEEVERMYQVARDNNVILFEAFKTAWLPNFAVIKNNLAKLGNLHRAYISYCQYSSRYQKYLDGETPNTFNPAFSNGSIMDIGYYCVAMSVALFGEPKTVTATASLLGSGVDAHGSAIFSYDGMEVVITHSKVSDSYLPSEIQGEDGALLIDHFSECDRVIFRPRGGQEVDLTEVQNDNRMMYEARAFCEQINAGKMDSQAVERSIVTARVLTEIRRQTGVVYPADQG